MERVLHIGLSNQIGGIEKFLSNVYINIDKEILQFDFITTCSDLQMYNEFTHMGAKVYLIPPIKNIFGYYLEMNKIIKNNNYKIVHIHKNSCANIIPFIICKKLQVKCIIAHAHSTSSNYGKMVNIFHYLFRPIMRKCITDGFGCSSEAINWLFGKKYALNNCIKKINNGIDVNRYVFSQKIRKIKRSQLNISDNNILLAHVGKFAKVKNHRFLIEVFKRVYQEDNRYRLMLIGKGPLQNEIMQEVQREKLGESVLFLGQRDDVNELLQACDAFVFPSVYEGLSIATIEAQASGLKLLCSNQISKETDITSSVQFLPIDNINIWVEKILELNNTYKRIDNSKKIIDAGYDSYSTAFYLQKYYLAKLKIQIDKSALIKCNS